MPNLTTIAKWAESMSISRQQGYAAIERCGIPVTDGQVDPDYATHLYGKHTRKRAKGNRPAPLASAAPSAAPAGAGGEESVDKVPGYDTSRARREAAEAALAEMKEAEMRGRYLVKTEVDAAVFEIARALRDGLTNCARRIAADVAGLSGAAECEEVIDREHRALQVSMVQAFGAKLRVQASENSEAG